MFLIPMSGHSPSANRQLRLRRSGEPSRLSLRKRWIFRLAFTNDMGMRNTFLSAHLLHYQHELKKIQTTTPTNQPTPAPTTFFVCTANKVQWLIIEYVGKRPAIATRHILLSASLTVFSIQTKKVSSKRSADFQSVVLFLFHY